jgi:hypothetical protein
VSINAKIRYRQCVSEISLFQRKKILFGFFLYKEMLSSKKIYKNGRIELGQNHGQSMRSTLYYKAGAM